jgi:hypothetical protein
VRHRVKEEPSKIPIRQDRVITVTRAAVHLLPVLATITLVTLNIQTCYVGAHSSWTPALQFVAKAQEVLMHASIAAGFFAYLRHELLSGDDMPFGALSSALQVRNVGYLWSLEFWGSATSPCLRGRRKYSFLLLVLSSLLLTATVGPSVAIALIPGRPVIQLPMYQSNYGLQRMRSIRIPLAPIMSPVIVSKRTATSTLARIVRTVTGCFSMR